jgi:hypothetical protein
MRHSDRSISIVATAIHHRNHGYREDVGSWRRGCVIGIAVMGMRDRNRRYREDARHDSWQ